MGGGGEGETARIGFKPIYKISFVMEALQGNVLKIFLVKYRFCSPRYTVHRGGRITCLG